MPVELMLEKLAECNEGSMKSVLYKNDQSGPSIRIL
jgi:hypothetical protein